MRLSHKQGRSMSICLVLKQTLRCNFNCTFCSSPRTNEPDIPVDEVIEYIKSHDVNSLILNGGDPLMISPDDYHKLFTFMQHHNPGVGISFTTNLWDFYLNPEKWIPIFSYPNVRVSTSFNYGKERRVSANHIFTEDRFREVVKLFKKHIKYPLNFIAIIDHKNEKQALDHVYLAKELDLVAKVNPALKSGRKSRTFPFWKMIDIYYEIYEKGLAKYERNTQLIVDNRRDKQTPCPFNRDCFKGIRCLQSDDEYYCGAFGDERKHPVGEPPYTYDMIKDDCKNCSLFTICNGCYKRIHDIIEDGETEVHCREMKKRERLINSMR